MVDSHMNKDSWDSLRHAERCDICAPREPNNEHRLLIAPLAISTLYLFRDQRFRGYSLLTFDARHATALEELSEIEYAAYMSDLRRASNAIRRALHPDHMNYECLGNSNPHLHWHIIPRYKNDPRWGQPIWEGWPRTEFTINRFVLPESEYAEMAETIRSQLLVK